MTTPSTKSTSARSADVSPGAPAPGQEISTQPGGALASGQGKTSIAPTVVTKIAGLAAREVSGVYKLGGGAARAFGAIRERVPGARSSVGQGVSVEVGERQAAVDLEVMVEYGVDIVELAKAIRRNVSTSIERMTGLEVTEVNISVDDIHLPDDDADDQDDQDDQGSNQPRVQ